MAAQDETEAPFSSSVGASAERQLFVDNIRLRNARLSGDLRIQRELEAIIGRKQKASQEDPIGLGEVDPRSLSPADRVTLESLKERLTEHEQAAPKDRELVYQLFPTLRSWDEGERLLEMMRSKVKQARSYAAQKKRAAKARQAERPKKSDEDEVLVPLVLHLKRDRGMTERGIVGHVNGLIQSNHRITYPDGNSVEMEHQIGRKRVRNILRKVAENSGAPLS
jgi:hypothetical protein